MNDELITSENLSPELLKSVFDSAFMEAKMEEDGEILVKEAVTVRVRANMERKDRIRLTSIFGFVEGASRLERLECANHINEEYIVVCASVINDLLFFRYDLCLAGGLTKKSLILSLKRFAGIPHDAVNEHGKGIVE